MKKKKQEQEGVALAINTYNNIIQTCNEMSKRLKDFENTIHKLLREILEE